MSDNPSPKYTGGCQCGAVRYSFRHVEPFDPHICHCTDVPEGVRLSVFAPFFAG